MEIDEAQRRADQILNDERLGPTISYAPKSTLPGESTLARFAEATAHFGPLSRKRPRMVLEPSSYIQVRFGGTNYDLLVALLSHVPDASRSQFFSHIIGRIANPNSFHTIKSDRLPTQEAPRYTSELPLVAEFTLRQGIKGDLFAKISAAKPSPGILLLLLQLEDAVALNFQLFSEKELADLSAAILSFLRSFRGQRALEQSRTKARLMRQRPRPHQQDVNPIKFKDNVRIVRLEEELTEVCQSICEECRKAQYFYLKGLLLQSANFEINQDKETVVSYLKTLGFNATLIASLETAERLYRTAGSTFDFKSSMSHLRSFLEVLHIEAARRVHAGGAATTPAPAKWGEAIFFLKEQSVLTQQEWAMIGPFYTLMSDKAVHPLIAEREYARLLRNMTIEYGLLFLERLQKTGHGAP